MSLKTDYGWNEDDYVQADEKMSELTVTITLCEYRNLIRISEAKRMIDSGEFTVIESAYLTGFNNMSFFYEVYNRYFPKH